MSAYDLPLDTKPASQSATVGAAAVAALPALIRVVRTRKVSMADAVTLGGAAMAVWGRWRASRPLRAG